MRNLKERVEAWSRVISQSEDKSTYHSPVDILRDISQNINPIRSKIFSEFAMETSPNDEIHYYRRRRPKLIGDGYYRVIEETAKEEFNQIWDIVDTLKM